MYPQKLFNLALLCPVFFLTTSLAAQEKPVKRLTLSQALSIAEENNAQILQSGIENEIASEEADEAAELRLPDVDFHTSYARVSNITEFTSGVLGGRRVTNLLPEIADVSIMGRMPLYQGSRIKNIIRKAHINKGKAGVALEKTKKDIRLTVTAVFLEAWRLTELDKLLTANVAEEKDRLKEVNALLKNGAVTKNEVLRAELQLSDRELMLLNNKKEIEIALDELKTLLQFPEEQSLVIDTRELDAKADLSYAMLENAAAVSEEVRMAQQDAEMGEADVKIAKANYYPSINLFGNYGYNYPNYKFFPPDPYAYTMGQIGVEAVFNLSGLYKNKTRIELAKKKAEAVHAGVQVVKNRVHDTIFRQYKQYTEITDKFKVTDRAEVLATENYRLVKLQYLNQLVVITEMIDADNALLEAQYNKIAVHIEATAKYYELLHTAGLAIK